MTEDEMLTLLAPCAVGTTLFVSYLPGRTPSTRAREEAQRALAEGISPRHFTGTLESLKKNKRGDWVVTLWVNERDTMGPEGASVGNYRAFNPSLGTLLAMDVIQRMPVGCCAL